MKITIEHDGHRIELSDSDIEKLEVRTVHHPLGPGVTLEAPGVHWWEEVG